MRPVYCDESILIPVADGVRRRGWSVHVARDEGMLGESDRTQLKFAKENDWVLLTFDDDFLALVEAAGYAHAGIIYIDKAGREIGEIIKAVDSHLVQRPADEYGISYL